MIDEQHSRAPEVDPEGRHHALAQHGDAHGDVDWDQRYSTADQMWSGEPNGALVAEVAVLDPGRALDVGCGEGADAIWLAQRGWDVVAIDVARVALDRAHAAAAAAGVEVAWQLTGLLDAPPARGGYDLVSAQYPALLRTPTRAVERSLVAAVAPGGHLLVVHHADVDEEMARAHGFDPELYVSPSDVASVIDGGWRVVVDERRPRHLEAGAGAGHTHDLVFHAVRSP